MTEKTLRKIDIFVSSPSDVDEERRIASEVIELLNSSPFITDRCALKPLAYEKIVPAAVGETPQKTVDCYMILPDQADIFICIMWSRMGTPIIDSEGKKYQSGTEYEFTTAYKAYQENEKPYILLYRGMKNIPIEADFRQVGLVKAFFEKFKGNEADFKGFYKKYKNNEEFKEILRYDLEKIISKIIPLASDGKITPVYASSELQYYPSQLKDFVTQNRADEWQPKTDRTTMKLIQIQLWYDAKLIDNTMKSEIQRTLLYQFIKGED